MAKQKKPVFFTNKYICDNKSGLWYELQGDYYILCLEIPNEKEERYIGVWEQRHLRYIREYKKALYISRHYLSRRIVYAKY